MVDLWANMMNAQEWEIEKYLSQHIEESMMVVTLYSPEIVAASMTMDLR